MSTTLAHTLLAAVAAVVLVRTQVITPMEAAAALVGGLVEPCACTAIQVTVALVAHSAILAQTALVAAAAMAVTAVAQEAVAALGSTMTVVDQVAAAVVFCPALVVLVAATTTAVVTVVVLETVVVLTAELTQASSLAVQVAAVGVHLEVAAVTLVVALEVQQSQEHLCL